MSESLGSAVLDLKADAGPLTRAVNAAHLSTIKQFKATSMASKTAMAAGMLAVGAAVGVGLYKVGEQFDEAFDAIRVGTGATGKDLESLKGSFRKVFAEVPDDAKTVGEAIADVNTRLGLTGKPLESLTTQFVNLSRITGTDVKTNIEAVSKAFRDWEVKTGDQEKTLDGFFRISQATGISVDGLAAKVQQFGSPLRQLGFTLSESASMFGIFESAGVNVETLMPGFKMAIGNVLKPTDDLSAGMKKLGVDMDSGPKVAISEFIKKIENAKDPMKLMGLAIDFFGKKAGPDMVEAISQGRLNLTDMLDVFENGGDTINGASDDTMDFSEKLQLLKNRGMLALEKPAMAVFDGMTKLADVMLAVTDAFSGLPAGVRQAIVTAAALAAGLIALVFAFTKVKAALIAIQLMMAANPYVLIIAATIAIAMLIYKNWDKIKGYLSAVWNWIKDAAANVWGAIRDFFAKYWEKLLVIFLGPIGLLTVLVIKNWSKIRDAAKAIWKVIQTVIVGYVKILKTIVVTIWKGIRAAAQTIWQAIRSRIVDPIRAAVSTLRAINSAVRDWLRGAWGSIRDAATTIWGAVRERMVSPIRTAVEFIRTAISNVKAWLSERWSEIASRVGSFGTQMKSALVSAFKSAANAVIDFINAIIGAINKIPGVNIAPLSKLAAGGQVSRNQVRSAAGVQTFADGGLTTQGGQVTAPALLWGEDAPRYPEWVIPENPRYRTRAIGLLIKAAASLGVSAFAAGGRAPGTGGISLSGLAGGALDLITGGAGFIIDKLPNPNDYLPDWMSGTGSWVIDKISSWIKEKVKSVLDSVIPGFGGGSGGGAGGLAGLDGWVSSLAHNMGLQTTSGYRPGDDGYHGVNRARDFSDGTATPAEFAFGTIMSKFAPILLELIHTPLGFGIKNGQRVSSFGAETDADHFDHVHVAMERGGLLERLAGANFLGSYGSGGVLPSDGMYFGHEGEHVGKPPVVNIKIADGMSWLKQFVNVEIVGSDRRAEQVYIAGTGV